MHQSFASAFLACEPQALPFLPLDFRDPEERRRAVAQASERGCAPEVVEALRRQHQRWGMSDAREANLQALAESGTAVVVTGQQVGLLLGPLYTFYKAATAVILARTLAQETGHTVVPLFWLQTEDHDLEEIRACSLPQTGGEPLRLEMPAPPPQEQARVSISQRQLGAPIADVMETLREELAGLPHADDVLALFAQHYQPDRSWGDAFAGVLAALFASDGLLLLDPRDPALARLARSVHWRAMEESEAIAAALTERADALQEAGFRVQVPIRSDCSLSFFHPDGPDGERFRIVPQADGVALAGHDGTSDWSTLKELLDRAPLQWSTSALLRPIWQDTLLPTAAYVGGPGELSYYAQLEPLYRWFQLPMPLIAPRGRFVVVDPKAQAVLEEWQLSADALQASELSLLERLREGNAPGPSADEVQARLLRPFSEALATLERELLQLDTDLKKPIDKTHRSVEGAIEKLAHKVKRVRLHHNQQLVQKLQTVRAWLFPLDQPQERVLSLPYFLARFGLARFKGALEDTYAPFSAAVKELRL